MRFQKRPHLLVCSQLPIHQLEKDLLHQLRVAWQIRHNAHLQHQRRGNLLPRLGPDRDRSS